MDAWSIRADIYDTTENVPLLLRIRTTDGAFARMSTEVRALWMARSSSVVDDRREEHKVFVSGPLWKSCPTSDVSGWSFGFSSTGIYSTSSVHLAVTGL